MLSASKPVSSEQRVKMATERLSDSKTWKLIQSVQDHPCRWDSRVSDHFNRDKAREGYVERAGQMGNAKTGEVVCFAGLSVMVFKTMYICVVWFSIFVQTTARPALKKRFYFFLPHSNT